MDRKEFERDLLDFIWLNSQICWSNCASSVTTLFHTKTKFNTQKGRVASQHLQYNTNTDNRQLEKSQGTQGNTKTIYDLKSQFDELIK